MLPEFNVPILRPSRSRLDFGKLFLCLLCGWWLLDALPLGAQTNSAPGANLDHVTLQLKWTHQFQFAGYYEAIEQGYYRDAGLDVTLLEAQPEHDPIDTVLQGRAEFGVGTSNLLLVRAAGKPVVVLGVIYQHSPLLLVARRDAGVGDIHDLVGKPIMIEPEGEDVYAYFRNEGVDLKKLNVVPHSFNLRDLTDKKVAAITAYSTDEPFRLRAEGVDFLEFSPRAGGVDFYGDNLFTTEAQIHDHPDRVRAFRAASFKGWAYALAHQEETVDLILSKYNRGRTREQLLFEAQETERLMHHDLIEVGYMNPGRWQHISDTFEEQGMLPKHVALRDFMYDPNPKPDLRVLYALLIALAALSTGALVWLLPLLYFYRKRNREIARRVIVEKELLEAKARAEESNDAKSRFLAVLSHEVRSPIGGIANLLELMLQDRQELPGTVREDLQVLKESSRSLYQLVDELLEWSRCEANGVEIEMIPVTLRTFAEDLRRLFLPLAEAKQVEFNCSLEDGVPETILSDGLRLRQIVSNLLANAIKFTASGSVGLVISRGEEGRLRFAVTDTGIGISPEGVKRLFKPYQQADSSIARKFGGSGLGLSISLHLAKLLGGDIKVQSELGRGSTFTLVIVAESLDDAPSESGAKSTSAQ